MEPDKSEVKITTKAIEISMNKRLPIFWPKLCLDPISKKPLKFWWLKPEIVTDSDDELGQDHSNYVPDKAKSKCHCSFGPPEEAHAEDSFDYDRDRDESDSDTGSDVYLGVEKPLLLDKISRFSDD